MGEKGKQVVLIHGACHGAWCWYKVKPLLQQAGYRVTALDMAGAGVHPMQMDEVQEITLLDYSQPLIQLLNSIPDDDDDQKVILVGHSLGGLNLALAMEMFPHKIEAVIFLTAFVPDTHHSPSFVVEQINKSNSSQIRAYGPTKKDNMVFLPLLMIQNTPLSKIARALLTT